MPSNTSKKLGSTESSTESSRTRRKTKPDHSKQISRRSRGPYHKACAPCARAKRQCDGNRPCSRCVQRNQVHMCVDCLDKRSSKKNAGQLSDEAQVQSLQIAPPPKYHSSDPDLVLARPLPGYPAPPPGGGIWGMQMNDPATASAKKDPAAGMQGPQLPLREEQQSIESYGIVLGGSRRSMSSPMGRVSQPAEFAAAAEGVGEPGKYETTSRRDMLRHRAQTGRPGSYESLGSMEDPCFASGSSAMGGDASPTVRDIIRGISSTSTSDTRIQIGANQGSVVQSDGMQQHSQSTGESIHAAPIMLSQNAQHGFGGSSDSLPTSEVDLFVDPGTGSTQGRQQQRQRQMQVQRAGYDSREIAGPDGEPQHGSLVSSVIAPSMSGGTTGYDGSNQGHIQDVVSQGQGRFMQVPWGSRSRALPPLEALQSRSQAQAQAYGSEPDGSGAGGMQSLGQHSLAYVYGLSVPPASVAGGNGGLVSAGQKMTRHNTLVPGSKNRLVAAGIGLTSTVVSRAGDAADIRSVDQGALYAARKPPVNHIAGLGYIGGLGGSSDSIHPSRVTSMPGQHVHLERNTKPLHAGTKSRSLLSREGDTCHGVAYESEDKVEQDMYASDDKRRSTMGPAWRSSAESDSASMAQGVKVAPAAHGNTTEPEPSSRTWQQSVKSRYGHVGAPPATALLMDEGGQVRFSLPLRRQNRRQAVEGFYGVTIDECGGLRIQLGDFSRDTGQGNLGGYVPQLAREAAGVHGSGAGIRGLVGPESHFGLVVPGDIESEIDASIGRVGDLPAGAASWMPEDDAACAALACSDVPSVHYVHDGRYLKPAFVWYSPSALQFLRMDRDRLRWLLGALKGDVSGKPADGRSKRNGTNRTSSSLAPFIWIHPDDVPAHSAAILRQHLVRYEESRSMARVVVFSSPHEPDYGSGASVVSGTTGTTRTLGQSTVASSGSTMEKTGVQLPGPAASSHPLDNLVGRALPCAWVTRLHWHGVCPRAMTVVMHPLPRSGWHMRAFYNMPRGLSSHQQRLLASQLRMAVRAGVLQQPPIIEGAAPRAGFSSVNAVEQSQPQRDGDRLRRYGTSQTLGSSVLGGRVLAHMGPSGESRTGSVQGTPRIAHQDDQVAHGFDPLAEPPNSHGESNQQDSGAEHQEMPRLAIAGRDLNVSRLQRSRSSGEGQLRFGAYDSSPADIEELEHAMDGRVQNDKPWRSPHEVMGPSAARQDSDMQSSRGASAASETISRIGDGPEKSNRWSSHEGLRGNSGTVQDRVIASPVITTRDLGTGHQQPRSGLMQHRAGPHDSHSPGVPKLNLRKAKPGDMLNLSRHQSIGSQSMGRESGYGDSDRSMRSSHGKHLHPEGGGPRAALTASMRPKARREGSSDSIGSSVSPIRRDSRQGAGRRNMARAGLAQPDILAANEVLDSMQRGGARMESAQSSNGISAGANRSIQMDDLTISGGLGGLTLHGSATSGSMTSRASSGSLQFRLTPKGGDRVHHLEGGRLGGIRGKYASADQGGGLDRIQIYSAGGGTLAPLDEGRTRGVNMVGSIPGSSGVDRARIGAARVPRESQAEDETNADRRQLQVLPGRRALDVTEGPSSDEDDEEDARPARGSSQRNTSSAHTSTESTNASMIKAIATSSSRIQRTDSDMRSDDAESNTSSNSAGNRYRRMMLRPGEGKSSRPLTMSRRSADPTGGSADDKPRGKPNAMNFAETDGLLSPSSERPPPAFRASRRESDGRKASGPVMSTNHSDAVSVTSSLQSSVVPRKQGRFTSGKSRRSRLSGFSGMVPFGSSAAMLDDTTASGLGLGVASSDSNGLLDSLSGERSMRHLGEAYASSQSPPIIAKLVGRHIGQSSADGRYGFIGTVSGAAHQASHRATGSEMAQVGSTSQLPNVRDSHPASEFAVDPIDGGRDPRQVSLLGPYGLRLLQLAANEVRFAIATHGELSAAMHRVVEIGDSMWPVLDAVGITTGRGVQGQHLVSTGSAKTSMGLPEGSDPRDDYVGSAATKAGSSGGSRPQISFDRRSVSTAGRGSTRTHGSLNVQSSAVSVLAFPALFRAARTIAAVLQNPEQVKEHPQRQMLLAILPATTLAPKSSAAAGGRAGSRDQLGVGPTVAFEARAGPGLTGSASNASPVVQSLGGKRTRGERRNRTAADPSKAEAAQGTGMPPPMLASATQGPVSRAELPFSIQIALELAPVPIGLAARANSTALLSRSFEVAELLVGAASRAMQIQSAYELTTNPYQSSVHQAGYQTTHRTGGRA